MVTVETSVVNPSGQTDEQYAQHPGCLFVDNHWKDWD